MGMCRDEKIRGCVLISACLLGEKCKYNGGDNYSPQIEKILEDVEVLALCPEVLGGLPTPRAKSEILDGHVVTEYGDSVDEAFRLGVERALEAIGNREITCAILQSRSPSCGVREIYNGSFSGQLIPGRGIFASALAQRGIPLVDAQELIEGNREGASDE
ncbi:MAG: DUF523 domain-containing protein [Tissierellia bacterium]|nr:DUF523 domain-containing protein [Tissierellia bacterium]